MSSDDKILAVFGDESCAFREEGNQHSSVITYCLCLLRIYDVENYQNSIIEDAYKSILPREYVLHCRELFNGSSRKRNPIASGLTANDVFDLYDRLANFISLQNIYFIVAMADRLILPRRLLFGPKLNKNNAIIDSGVNVREFCNNDLIYLCKNICFHPIIQTVGLEKSRIILGRHRDKFTFVGTNPKRQMNKMPGILIPKFAAAGGLARLSPDSFEESNSTTMLGIADFVAYIISKNIARSKKTDYHQKQYSQLYDKIASKVSFAIMNRNFAFQVDEAGMIDKINRLISVQTM